MSCDEMITLYANLTLSDICNSSFLQEVFPDINKIVEVIPIHNGTFDDVNNNRPISLFIFSKLMKKYMATRLNTFLVINNILYSKRFCFRSGYSTAYFLIGIVETVRQTLDRRKFGCGVFIDLRKAIGTVDHNILL